MPHNHHVLFVGLSLVVAVLGSWTALDLFRRVRSHIGRAQRVWLVATAVAMGLSIWSMHFIAMLGFDPGAPVSYDLPLTFLSLVLAIGATSGAFFAASREGATLRGLLTAGFAMGAGICLMHYVGMAAMRTAVAVGYRPGYVAASLVIAVVASTAALFAGRRERSFAWRMIAAATLGFAIAGMHYTAMAGLELTHAPGGAMPMSGAPPSVLGLGVAAGTLAILFLALLASLYDERLNVLAALEAGRVGYWELTVPDMTLQVSPRAKEVLGHAPDAPFVRADFLRLLPPDEFARSQILLSAAIASGGEYDAEYRLAGPGVDGRWINVRGQVIAWFRGRPRRMAGIMVDVTDRRRAFDALADADRRQRLLIDELNHRVKNTLATVQSVARQTAKGAASLDAFQPAFEARLISLSQTHNALTRGAWEHASLRELLEQEFSPYGPEQFRAAGPEVSLRPRQALAIGMILHELATNAAKHGALSRTTGHVKVDWRLEPPETLVLDWAESGGPAVTPSSRRGFGSRLIKGAVETELSGTAEFDYAPAGFEGRFRLPLA